MSSARSLNKWIGIVALLAVLGAALTFSPLNPVANAQAREEVKSGIFVGTDPNGNFQNALEDAVANAAAAAGCCDIRITYQVLETTGQHGGFLFLNDVNVKIHAQW